MRKYLFLILASLVCLSCTSESKKVTHNTDAIKGVVKTDTIAVESKVDHRDQIISEIERFKNAINAKNKVQILSFFNFPLADISVSFFEVDSAFDAKRKLNDGKITKETFVGSFDKIYELAEMKEFKNIFSELDLIQLKIGDNYRKELRPVGDGCYYIYKISIEGDLVYMQYGTNSNDDYRKIHPEEEEICDEFAHMWTFKFDGNRLYFLTHRVAG